MRLNKNLSMAFLVGAGLLAVILVILVIVKPLPSGVNPFQPGPKAVPVRPADRLPFNGEPFFWAGVNYPWKTYQDFGTGAWGHGGVSHPTTYSEIDTDFANMAAQGIRVVKWRVFGDGRYSPDIDVKGTVTGLDEYFYPDVDAALEIAQRHDMYLVLSLFSSGFWTLNCEKKDVHFGAGPDVIADSGRRSAMMKRAIIPFLKHVGKNPRVLAYEIVAEPEWGVKELQKEQDYRQKTSLAAVRAFVKEVSNAVHQHTSALSSLESNRPRNLRYWKGLGLDFYSVSWYDWMAEWDPLDADIMALEADRPVVLGEFPVNSQYYSVEQVLDIAYTRGFAGAFPWSYTAGDRFSEWYKVQVQYTAWVQQHWSEVDFATTPLSEPQLNPQVKAQPFGFDRLQLSSFGNSLSVGVDMLARDGGIFVTKFFLYQDNDTPTGLQQEKLTAFNNTNRLPVTVNFAGLEAGKTYKLNVGIFGSSDNLVKWFDSVARFELKNGQVETPDRPVEVDENPCR